MTRKDLKKMSKEHNIYRPTYKDVGTCLRQDGFRQINRSKFRTAEDAKEQLNNLLNIGVGNNLHIVYRCSFCKMWHFGLKEWAKK